MQMQIPHSLVVLVVALGLFGTGNATPTNTGTCFKEIVVPVEVVETCPEPIVISIKTVYQSVKETITDCPCTNDFTDPANVQLIADTACKNGLVFGPYTTSKRSIFERGPACQSYSIVPRETNEQKLSRRHFDLDGNQNDNFNENENENVVNPFGFDFGRFTPGCGGCGRCGRCDFSDSDDESFFNDNNNQNINQNINANENLHADKKHRGRKHMKRDLAKRGRCNDDDDFRAFDDNDNQNINQNINANQNLLANLAKFDHFFKKPHGFFGGASASGGCPHDAFNGIGFNDNDDTFHVSNKVDFHDRGFFKREKRGFEDIIGNAGEGAKERFLSDNDHHNINQNLNANQNENENMEEGGFRNDFFKMFRNFGSGSRGCGRFCKRSHECNCPGCNSIGRNIDTNVNDNVNTNTNVNTNYYTNYKTVPIVETYEVQEIVPVYETVQTIETVPVYETVQTVETVPVLETVYNTIPAVEVNPVVETVVETAPIIETLPIIETAPIIQTAPTVETFVETAPVIETFPIIETAPVIETGPIVETVVETAPVIETFPIIETAPVIETVPVVETVIETVPIVETVVETAPVVAEEVVVGINEFFGPDFDLAFYTQADCGIPNFPTFTVGGCPGNRIF